MSSINDHVNVAEQTRYHRNPPEECGRAVRPAMAASHEITLDSALSSARVDKIHEARVVVVGERTFTILIRAGSQASQVDWRADYPALSYEWIETPHEIEKGLQAYLAELGLAYSAIDFAIDADGRWVFLESNSSGQYFWLESHTGAPITNALADLLAERG
ncbi:MAG: hypothetical protein LC776_06485 [Acidobacteria bacterium]|nr:hypothetical protein [Acidobacteriota bacterium]